MTHASTEAVFSATASTYDPARAKLIPCYADFYTAAIKALPATPISVLDLGAGTGLLSAFIRERFPQARIHLLDNSDPMLAKARERFAGDTNVSFELGDYTCGAFTTRYHAIASALSIHHLTNEAKRALFANIYAALEPGGVFVNAEQILQPTPVLEAQAKKKWLADVRALGATERQVADSLLRQTEDRCATVANQILWMSDAGFANARCSFSEGRFAVLTGTRTT